MKVLECYSKGDRRFSALYARLADERTIENIYQSAKRDENGKPYPSAKGKKPSYLRILGQNVPCNDELRHTFYTMLWWIFFMENPELCEEAAQYEGFKDIYDGHRGIVYKKGRDDFFPEAIEDSCCQATAIAFLVGNSNCLVLPKVLIGAVEAYWTKHHEETIQDYRSV